jgi:hypothetical protein
MVKQSEEMRLKRLLDPPAEVNEIDILRGVVTLGSIPGSLTSSAKVVL